MQLPGNGRPGVGFIGGEHPGHHLIGDGSRAGLSGKLDHVVAPLATFGRVAFGAGVDEHQGAEVGGIFFCVRERDVAAHGEATENAGEDVEFLEQRVDIVGKRLDGEGTSVEGLAEAPQIGSDDAGIVGEGVALLDPDSAIEGKAMKEDDRGAGARFVIVERGAVDRAFGHVRSFRGYDVNGELVGWVRATRREADMVRIKICCIASEEESALAVKYGASCLGLVSAMPSGPGPISDERIAEIRKTIPPGVASYLLTCRQDSRGIVEQLRFTGCNTVQICDRLERGTYEEIREALPGVSIVQVIHVTGEESVGEAVEAGRKVDAVLLDSGKPKLAVKELGGTGRVHDWELSRRIRDAVRVPVYLAGGLNAANVAEAIERVNPFGVDLCSGVRTAGKLDEKKLAAFCRVFS